MSEAEEGAAEEVGLFMKWSGMKWVRPLITLIAVTGINAGFFMDKITSEAYLPLMAGTIVWWFKSRDDAKKKDGET